LRDNPSHESRRILQEEELKTKRGARGKRDGKLSVGDSSKAPPEASLSRWDDISRGKKLKEKVTEGKEMAWCTGLYPENVRGIHPIIARGVYVLKKSGFVQQRVLDREKRPGVRKILDIAS